MRSHNAVVTPIMTTSASIIATARQSQGGTKFCSILTRGPFSMATSIPQKPGRSVAPLTVCPAWGILSSTPMSKRHGPAPRYLARWSIKIFSISAVVVLVTAVYVRTAVAPSSVGQAIALQVATPDLATSLVSFTVLTPTQQPEPTPDSATATPIPTITEEPVIATLGNMVIARIR